ncbi:uncharacterized protein abi3bpa [Pholidichthys leucotaenia]
MRRMQQHSHGILTLLFVALISGIALSGPSLSRVRRQNMKVRISTTGDTIVMKFLRPSADTKLEGYILGYGSSMFSKQFIKLPENGRPYEIEFDAEPKYLIAVQPIPSNEVKKHCTGKVELEKPLHLVIGSVTPTSVLLSWGTLLKTPYEGNIMNDCLEDGHYTVRFREKNRKWNYQTCPTSETVIDNLKPNMLYEFGVQANSKDGTGTWSRPVVHNISTSGIEEKVVRKIFQRPINPVKPLTQGPHSIPLYPHTVLHNRTRGQPHLSRTIVPHTTLATTTTTKKESLPTPGPTHPVIKKQPIGGVRGGFSRPVLPLFPQPPLTPKLHPPLHIPPTIASPPLPKAKVESHGRHELPQPNSKFQPQYQPKKQPVPQPQQPQLKPKVRGQFLPKPPVQPEPQPLTTFQPMFETKTQLYTTSQPRQIQPHLCPTSQPSLQIQSQPKHQAISQGIDNMDPKSKFPLKQKTHKSVLQPQSTSQNKHQAQSETLESYRQVQPQPTSLPHHITTQLAPQLHTESPIHPQTQPQLKTSTQPQAVSTKQLPKPVIPLQPNPKAHPYPEKKLKPHHPAIKKKQPKTEKSPQPTSLPHHITTQLTPQLHTESPIHPQTQPQLKTSTQPQAVSTKQIPKPVIPLQPNPKAHLYPEKKLKPHQPAIKKKQPKTEQSPQPTSLPHHITTQLAPQLHTESPIHPQTQPQLKTSTQPQAVSTKQLPKPVIPLQPNPKAHPYPEKKLKPHHPAIKKKKPKTEKSPQPTSLPHHITTLLAPQLHTESPIHPQTQPQLKTSTQPQAVSTKQLPKRVIPLQPNPKAHLYPEKKLKLHHPAIKKKQPKTEKSPQPTSLPHHITTQLAPQLHTESPIHPQTQPQLKTSTQPQAVSTKQIPKRVIPLQPNPKAHLYPEKKLKPHHPAIKKKQPKTEKSPQLKKPPKSRISVKQPKIQPRPQSHVTLARPDSSPRPTPKAQPLPEPLQPHFPSKPQPKPHPGLHPHTKAVPTAPSPPEEGKPIPRPALATTKKAGSYDHGVGIPRSPIAEVPRSPISSSFPTAGRNATQTRSQVALPSINHGVGAFPPSKTGTSSHSPSKLGASGEHHRGSALPRPMVWSKEKPVLRPAVPGNKRPNLVGKPSAHDKPMDLKQGEKESILKPFAFVTPKPKQERRPQTTTTALPLNSSRFDISDNSSTFSPVPASEVDATGKKRFVAPHVIYKTDKKPDEPCSITTSLSYFPNEEGSDQNVTGPPRLPPSNVTVITVEGCPSFVILDWKKSDNETREYEVVSTTTGPTGQKTSVLTTNQTHTAVENLTPESSYEFKVTPMNEMGAGPSSEPVTFSTESADPRVSEHVSGKDAIWTQFPFKTDAYSECNGKQYVKRTWYRKFVGIQLCNSLRYKIYLSDSLNGKFYNIGDQTGYGEDHCQFVDSFLNGRTGAQMSADQLPSRPGFFRALRQEPVHFGEIGGKSHVTYVGWYECGTPIPGKW